MAKTQQAIMKAVEVSTTVGMSIGSPTHPTDPDFTVYPSQSFFPNILALAADLSQQMYDTTLSYSQGPVHIEIGITNTGLVRFYVVSSGSFPINYTIDSAYSPLGFAGGEAANIDPNIFDYTNSILVGSIRLATNPPEDCWLPSYYSADTMLFEPESERAFIGVTGVDGNLSGATFTERQVRDFEWKFQSAENAIEDSPNSTNLQSDRSFTKIINGARKNSLQISTDNTYCKGVYYVDDMLVFCSDLNPPEPGRDIPESWDSGSLKGDYVFCSTSVPRIQGASFDNTKNWYDVGCRLTTAVSPNWTWDIS